VVFAFGRLGGEDALRGINKAIARVTTWWK